MASAQAESSQYFENPRSGTRAFQVVVSRLILRTVTFGALVAAGLVASVHLYYRTGSLRNWLFLVAAAALALISWREARHSARAREGTTRYLSHSFGPRTW